MASILHVIPTPQSPASPKTKTLGTLLRGLASCSTMSELKQFHAQIIKLGLSCDNDAMGRVIKFCATLESGDLNYALQVFDKLPNPDTFIYNTIIRGYLQSQLLKESVLFYSQMLECSVSPNNFTLPLVIRACCMDNAVEEGKQIHGHVIKFGFGFDKFSQNNLIHMYVNFHFLEEAKRVLDNMYEKDDVSWTTLISGFAQLGYLAEAFRVFDSISEKSSVCWNAMISAYVHNNQFHQAFALFERMMSEDVVIDKFIAASMLSACTRLGALKQGEWIVEQVEKSRIDLDSKLATTIIDMYCKCGCLDKALQFFKGLRRKGISSWNCMIGGLAMHGKGEAAIELLKEMESERVAPDYITFVNLLSACAHSGLIEEGKHYFHYMKEAYGIEPGMEHYGCLVDLLGRAGLLEEARNIVKEMPMNADVGVLGALLGACRIHKNIELGEIIGKQVIELEPQNSGRYVLLANLYAYAGRWEDVANIRKLMNDRGVKKAPGFSVVELEGVVSEFTAGGRTHPQAKEIYAKVNEMLDCIKSAGYVPDSDGLQQDIDEEERENPLYYHSEKLAIAFGLLKTKPGAVLRITKNLRVCKDCHQASKLISKVYDREIIVRDRNRFHHFKDGECSCKDYW
ncbi:PREDICTED: pentatricopeptide repeat-containing protein At5g66520-like [Nicotiana attenuata]|uniref:Pentatricopeptide repeat-containing protein n=1 Tax=Nicotiana attenuata TaxID=49451 RepID=A0A1J6IRP0_NICAT|nr:PREDICTED: pentatricopeptide repeat-containing protein At5g66520-like [Nicotiana attenuata]OIT03240.1 pentatricopeptide repeat-containing protein [Nicotiana attenuata]